MASDLKAGRATDAIVAEKVMGWTVRRGVGLWRVVTPTTTRKVGGLDVIELMGEEEDVPRFSTDIAAAWLVVAKMRELNYWLELLHSWQACGAKFYDPRVTDGETINECEEVSAPLAICLAALQALAPHPPTQPTQENG